MTIIPESYPHNISVQLSLTQHEETLRKLRNTYLSDLPMAQIIVEKIRLHYLA